MSECCRCYLSSNPNQMLRRTLGERPFDTFRSGTTSATARHVGQRDRGDRVFCNGRGVPLSAGPLELLTT